MKKKVFVIFLLGLLILVNIASAQTPKDVERAIKNNTVVEGVQEIQKTVEEERWNYISERWKEVLLKNKFISFIDNFFRKVNIVFVVLFGQSYDLSIILFFIFILWIFFTLNFWNVIGNFTPLSKNTSIVVAIVLSILLAQLNFLNLIATFAVNIIFVGGTVSKWIRGVGSFLFLIIIWTVVIAIAKIQRERIKNKEELKQVLNQKILDQSVKGILKGAKK